MAISPTGIVDYCCPICGIKQESLVYVKSVRATSLLNSDGMVQLDPTLLTTYSTHLCNLANRTPQDR